MRVKSKVQFWGAVKSEIASVAGFWGCVTSTATTIIMGLPTLKFESLSRLSAKSDAYTLVLNARHQFVYASHLEPSCTVFKTAIPSDIDIVASGKLVLLLSGHLDGSEIPPGAYANSALGQYIVGFLRSVCMRPHCQYTSSWERRIPQTLQ